MEIGTRLIYKRAGALSWELIDEAAQAGLELEDIVTVEDFDPEDNSIKVKESLADTWMSADHFDVF